MPQMRLADFTASEDLHLALKQTASAEPTFFLLIEFSIRVSSVHVNAFSVNNLRIALYVSPKVCGFFLKVSLLAAAVLYLN